MSDHIPDTNKLVCVHCGLPADREQNGIQGYRCGSSFCKTFNVQWSRSMTCLEIENGQLQERIKRLEEDAGSNKLKAADDHIRALKIIISRASTAFFCDGSDGQVASRMLTILGEASKPITCEEQEAKP